jgi:hypothetical protein
MVQALITVNAVAGSNDNLPINTVVNLGNQGNGGELTYLWAIVNQPPGATDSLSATNVVSPTFTPKKEGTYLLQLIVNQGLPSECYNRVICGVRYVKSYQRAPAAGETTEYSLLTGWATAVNASATAFDTSTAVQDKVGVAGVGLALNDVVYVSGQTTLKAGLPGEEVVPTFSKALANSTPTLGNVFGIVVGTPSGGAVTAGQPVKVRLQGLTPSVAGAFVAGTVLYLSDTGVLSATAGTTTVKLAVSTATGGGVSTVYFFGSQADPTAVYPSLHYYTIVVGNALQGDLATECTYLDPGDGSGIAAAVTFMYAKRGTIIVRRGTYTRPSGSIPYLITGNVCLQGEGRGQTIIVAPPLDDSGIPWRVATLYGSEATIQDMSISVQARGVTGAAPSTSIGVVAAAASKTRVRRIAFSVDGAVTAFTVICGMVDYGAVTYGHSMEDTYLDMTNATLTGSGTNQFAFALITATAGFGTPVPYPVDPYNADYDTTSFRRCSLVGGKNSTAGSPYYTYGMIMHSMSQFDMEECSFSGVRSLLRGEWCSTAVGQKSYGPRLRDVTVYGTTVSMGLTEPTVGSIRILSDAGGTLDMQRLEYLNVNAFGGASGTQNVDLWLSLDSTSSLRGLKIEGCTLKANSATTTGAKIDVSSNSGGTLVAPSIQNNEVVDVGGAATTFKVALAAPGTGTITRANVSRNRTVDLSITGANGSNAIVSDNHYSGVLTNTGTATSFSNNVNA